MDVDARLEAVEAENEMLRERIIRLEGLLGMHIAAPIEFGLTPQETRVFGVLMARELATKDAVMAALYHSIAKEEAEVKIVDVFICKIRAKLKRFGIAIETQWGHGYFLTAATKARVKEMLAKPIGEAA